MRTHLSFVLHSGKFRAPIKNPVSDRAQNNVDLLLKESTLSFEEDSACAFTNIMKFCMQRFYDCLNLVSQILCMLFLRKFSLTMNNYHAIKTC